MMLTKELYIALLFQAGLQFNLVQIKGFIEHLPIRQMVKQLFLEKNQGIWTKVSPIQKNLEYIV